jgi:phosphoserine phosphatase
MCKSSFVETVLALNPRLAVFDCDGTLWDGDAGERFLYWELDRGLIPETVARWMRPRYRDYKDGQVAEEAICGEMVTIHAGLECAAIQQAAEEFFAGQIEAAIFPELQELVARLRRSGCDIWAVSSTNEWVIRSGCRRFGIPDDRILAASVHCDNGTASDRLRWVPTDDGKAEVIRQVIPGEVDAGFGNSMHDAAMLALARHAFAVNPNPDFQELAQKQGWSIYFP